MSDQKRSLKVVPSNSKSIEDIENDYWGLPDFNSYTVVECHRLRKIPVSDLKPKDIRLLISQEIGLPTLIPLSLDLLSESPLLKTDDSRGDLLQSVFNIKLTYWIEYEEQYFQLKSLATRAIEELKSPELIDQADYSLLQDLRRLL